MQKLLTRFLTVCSQGKWKHTAFLRQFCPGFCNFWVKGNIVLIHGGASGYQRVTSGVPQTGFRFGTCFVFIIYKWYIWDCHHILDYLRTMHLNFDSPTASATLQRDLNQLEDWARLWKMSFNTNKCSIVTFGNSGGNGAASENFLLWGTVLREVDSFKYLGVLVLNKLNWSEHINKNKSEAMRTLGLLRRALSVLLYSVLICS